MLIITIMKTLIITAHPSSKGFTHLIAEKYSSGVREKGGNFEIVDLYSNEYKQDFLKFENARELPNDSVKQILQKKITDADELVFVCPMWWMNVPSVMKNFFDINFSSGFAFKYSQNGRLIGLLKGKTARIFMTCDGPAFYYFLIGSPFKKIFKKTLSFCGIKIKSFTLFDVMRKKTDQDRERMLARVHALATK